MAVYKFMRRACFGVVLWLLSPAAFAQFVPNRYILILEDPPVTSQFASPASARTLAAANYRQQIEARQGTLRAQLEARQIQVTGSVSTLLNAIFVAAPASRVAELAALPGVLGVVPVRRYKLNLNRATGLMNAPAAWSALGGQANGGSGIKIAVLDTGIDQTNPAFQDSSLPMPDGYPICSGSDCDFTSNKVIVARSYVRQLAAGGGIDPTNPALDSRPDDYSPRDHEGHGTAIASAAAGVINTGLVTLSGMAPKAYLGNYKIYGSDEINGYTGDDVIILALEDAVNDGMNIVSFSTGSPAFTGPLDGGLPCVSPVAVPSDPSAAAFECAARAGMVIVVAAGNNGEDSAGNPIFSTVSSPADAPSVIAVGATTNSHYFLETVGVVSSGAPSSLKGIAANPAYDSNGYLIGPMGAMTAPLVDVTSLGNDGFACAALPSYSLTGAFALIQRGTCSFSTKATHAYAVGAAGVVFYMADASSLISPSGLDGYTIPFAMISQSDGLALKSFLASNPGASVTIDPGGQEVDDSPDSNELVGFSSRGPSVGDSLLKPELVATGEEMYMAAQSYDPQGFMYSSTGRAVAGGTSFATPLVSGAAALVMQSHPTFTAAQVKSALVNSASQAVTTDDSGNPVDIQSLGAGMLDAGAAVGATVTSSPATISFGVVTSGSFPLARYLQITNSGPASVTLSAAVSAESAGLGANVTLDKSTLTLAPNATTTLTATLTGSLPASGSYSGVVTLQGQGVSLRIPYIFLVGSGVAADIVPLSGTGFDGTVGQVIPEGIIAFKLVDPYGVPISGTPVTWTARGTGSRVINPDSATDACGIAAAQPVLGLLPGNYSFTANAGGHLYTFTGTARAVPTIYSGGMVNAASFESGAPVAPGSYAAIFGSGLSDGIDWAGSNTLPMALDYAFVSFDVPSAGISVPGHLIYVSPSQVNVQVPWELQGQTSAQVKVTIDYSNGNVVTVPLADYAPAFFEISPGVAAALDGSLSVVTSANPAVHGNTIHLFANGLGPVTNQPASGDPAPLNPLAETTTKPVVTIGGSNTTVSWSGLAPGAVGLYLIDVTVPPGLTAGTYPITVSIGGKTSKSSSLPVK